MVECGIEVYDKALGFVSKSQISLEASVGNVAIYRVGPESLPKYVVRRTVSDDCLYSCDCCYDEFGNNGVCEHIAALEIVTSRAEEDEKDDPNIIEQFESDVDDVIYNCSKRQLSPMLDQIFATMERNVREASNAVLMVNHCAEVCNERDCYGYFEDVMDDEYDFFRCIFRCASAESIAYTIRSSPVSYWGRDFLREVPNPILKEIPVLLNGAKSVDSSVEVMIAVRTGKSDEYLRSKKYSVSALTDVLSMAVPGTPGIAECGWKLWEKSDKAKNGSLFKIFENAGLHELNADICRDMFLKTHRITYFTGAVEHGVYTPDGLLMEAIADLGTRGEYEIEFLELMLDFGYGHLAAKTVLKHIPEITEANPHLETLGLCNEFHKAGFSYVAAEVTYYLLCNFIVPSFAAELAAECVFRPTYGNPLDQDPRFKSLEEYLR